MTVVLEFDTDYYYEFYDEYHISFQFFVNVGIFWDNEVQTDRSNINLRLKTNSIYQPVAYAVKYCKNVTYKAQTQLLAAWILRPL